ncbi:MAG: hypothetical protein MJE77_17790, partial [Proteobacteria bacterium]|nr:hypothetical protein [Pseudomonadota bacterium]
MRPIQRRAHLLRLVALNLLIFFHLETGIAEPRTAAIGPKTMPCPNDEDVIIVGKGGTACRPVSSVWTRIFLPEGVTPFYQQDPKLQKFHIKYDKRDRALSVMVKENTPVGAEGSIKFQGPDFEATIIIRAVDKRSMSRGEYFVKHISELEATMRALSAQVRALTQELAKEKARSAAAEENAWHARRRAHAAHARANAAEARANAAEARAEAAEARADASKEQVAKSRGREQAALGLVRTKEAQAQRTRHHMLVSVARELENKRTQRLMPEGGEARRVHDRITARFRYADWKYGYCIFDAELTLSPGRPFEIADAKVVAKDRQELPTSIVSPNVAWVRDDTTAITTVVSGSPTRMVFAVRVPPKMSTVDLRLMLFERGSDSPATFVLPAYDKLVNLWRPETAEEEERRLWGSQLVISPQLLVGAFWISNGVEGEGRELDATTFTSLGLRMTKGFSENFAVEVDIAG